MQKPLFATLLLASILRSTYAVPASLPTNPAQHWSSYGEMEISSTCRDDLDAARDYLKTLDTKHGRRLFTYGPVEEKSIVFSVRKSILALFYGRYSPTVRSGWVVRSGRSALTMSAGFRRTRGARP